jgi:hypothetical protein
MDNTPHSPPLVRRPIWWALVLGTLGLCLIVASQRVPLWGAIAWGFHRSPNFGLGLLPLLPIGAVLLLWRGLLRAGGEQQRARRTVLLALLCGVTFALGLSVKAGEPGGLVRLVILTVNPASGGFFEAAYASQAEPDWIATYPSLMKKHHHVYTHPPGGVAVMRWWLARTRSGSASSETAWVAAAQEITVTGASTQLTTLAEYCARIWKRPYTASDMAAALWGALTFTALSALLPACVYILTRALFGLEAAVHAAALTALVPSFVLFVPVSDLSYVFFGAVSLALLARGALHECPLLIICSGLVAGAGLAFSFVLLGVMLIGVLHLLFFTQKRAANSRLGFAACYVGAAALVVLVLWQQGVDWPAILRVTRAASVSGVGNIEAGLDPRVQFVFHIADLLTFLGLPVTILMACSMVRRNGVDQAGATGEEDAGDAATTPVAPADGGLARRRLALKALNWPALLWPTVLVVLLLNVLAPFAETARIWMPFMPPLLAVAGGTLAQQSRADTRLPLAVLVAQALQLLVFSLYLNVWSL